MWTPNWIGLVSIKMKEIPETPLCLSIMHRGKATAGHSDRQSAIQEEFSPETNSAGTLILDFQCPDLWSMHFCRPYHPVCGILLWQTKQINTSPLMNISKQYT